MRLRKRKLLSKEAKKDRMVYNLVILGTLILLFGYSIAFCAVSTNLKFEGSGTVKGEKRTSYYYNDGYFYTDLAQANNKNSSYRVKKNGSNVQKLRDLMDVMEENSNIYMMSTYNISSSETVNVSKNVNIYWNEFDKSNNEYGFYSSGNLNLTIQTVGSGSLNMSGSDTGAIFALGYALFRPENGMKVNLSGKIKISGFSGGGSSFFSIIDSTLNLTGVEVTGNSYPTAGLCYFYGISNFTFDSVNIHDNMGFIGTAGCDVRKITGSSVIYNNFYSGSSGSKQFDLRFSSSNIAVDGTGLTSGSKIGVSWGTSSFTPSSSNPVTIFKNITRSAITPGTNIIGDDGYTVAYGNDNDTTTIVLK